MKVVPSASIPRRTKPTAASATSVVTDTEMPNGSSTIVMFESLVATSSTRKTRNAVAVSAAAKATAIATTTSHRLRRPGGAKTRAAERNVSSMPSPVCVLRAAYRCCLPALVTSL